MYICYRYREVIIQTFIIAGLVAAGLVVVGVIGVIARWRWRRPTLTRRTEIQNDADMLERPDTEVRWTPAGDLEITRKSS